MCCFLVEIAYAILLDHCWSTNACIAIALIHAGALCYYRAYNGQAGRVYNSATRVLSVNVIIVYAN